MYNVSIFIYSVTKYFKKRTYTKKKLELFCQPRKKKHSYLNTTQGQPKLKSVERDLAKQTSKIFTNLKFSHVCYLSMTHS